MKKVSIVIVFLLLQMIYACADYPKLPVFDLSYELSYGTEEEEESGDIIADSIRHSIILRIKEELAKSFYFAFPFQYTVKDNFDSDDAYNNYYYLRFTPYLSWDITEKSNLKFYITGKWFDYELPDSEDNSKDFYMMSTQVAWTYKVFSNFKLLSDFKSEYGFYLNPAKQSQSYNFRLGSSLQINKYTLSGRYNGKIMLPLGEDSEKEIDTLNAFKIDLTLDLNK
ncbi:MAG: hypothetical protein JXB88_06755 [Spirochaetales bacterium]|nr:hypothetical protein [Spirochaetales bacterium]